MLSCAHFNASGCLARITRPYHHRLDLDRRAKSATFDVKAGRQMVEILQFAKRRSVGNETVKKI